MQSQATVGRDGTLVASGYGLKLYVDKGHLIIEDGVGRNRRAARLNRATSRLKRLFVIGHTGFITLEALRWVRDIGASFVQIDPDGELIALSANKGNQDAWRRRAQAQAAGTDAGVAITRELISAKIEGQANVVERLSHLRPFVATNGSRKCDQPIQEAIAAQADRARMAESLVEVANAERLAARYYWSTWSRLPVRFSSWWGCRLPDHWVTAGNRTNRTQPDPSPRNARTPVQAMLNYGYAILENEALIAIHEFGLDPGIALSHATRRHRHNLVADLMEPARPIVDAAVLDLLDQRVLGQGDVYETRDGRCRIGPPLAGEIARHAPAFYEAVSPHCFGVVRTLLAKDGVAPTRGRRVGVRVTSHT
jgi:CRISPR-associated endonuclease Cas1